MNAPISKELYVFNSRILTHILFWVCYYIFFSLLWAKEGRWFQSFELEFVLMPIRIASSYLSLYYLIPRFLKKEKIGNFFASYFILVVVGGLAQRILTFYFHEGFFQNNSQIWDASLIIRSIVLINSTVMFLTSLKIYKIWIEERKSGKNPKEEILEIRSDKRIYKVLPSTILVIEGLGNYITLYLSNGKSLISYMTLKEAEALLPLTFKRIHKSFIINKDRIESFNNENVEIAGRIIPIGKSYELQ